MKRLIWLPLAGFLLVAGAAIATAAAAPSVTPSAQTNQDAASAAPTAAASPATNDQNGNPGQPPFGFGFGHGMVGGGPDVLDQVLSDLVKAGTITQDQSDAITKALQQQITDRQTQAQQDRQKALQEWQQVQGFLQDGVITQDEVNQLPADSPFRQIFNSIAQNGQITLQQLQQLRMFGPGVMGPGGRPGFGRPGGPWDSGNGQGQNPNPQASPSTTSTSS
jgi:polyhydroxyalkanoate synthesis regulator phasin